jgi:hypothetical protein
MEVLRNTFKPNFLVSKKSMSSFKNVLEEIVVVEVRDRLKHLSEPAREGINISEVAAFSLNRLPVLYASTNRGWLQQRNRAKNELQHQILSAVRQGLLGVMRDPLRKPTRVISRDSETPAHVLVRLQKLFRNPSLRWQEVPQAFLQALNSDACMSEYVGLSISDRCRVRDVKGYLLRKGSSRQRSQSTNNTVEFTNPVLESYLLSASIMATNVLENLAIKEVKKQLTKMANILPRKVEIDDACAYVLNRLPAMYATTKQGAIWQTQKVEQSLSCQVESIVIQSLMTLAKSPRRFADPLPFIKFEQECDLAVQELRHTFQRADITWRNIVSLAEHAIHFEKRGMTYWRQQWRLLGQIYSEMYLNPGEAELSIFPSPHGEVLIVRAYTKEAFGLVADNPKKLGISTLRHFPSVSEISLCTFFLNFPINYTRQEMLADGII